MNDEARRAAGILAQCKWLKDQIKQWEDEAKKTLALEADGGERLKAVLPDGTPIGSVSMVEGSKTMRIDNEEGFLVWVKNRYPHEVVETVRPAFVKLCAEKVKALGGLPDANGELCPHVSLDQGDPYPKANLGKDADAVMQHMIAARAHWWETITQQPELPVAQGDSAIAGAMHESELWEGEVMPEGYVPQREYEADRIAQQYLEATPPPVSNETPPEEDTDPEPFIEEGPPNWPDSNTFETSDAVHQRRMK